MISDQPDLLTWQALHVLAFLDFYCEMVLPCKKQAAPSANRSATQGVVIVRLLLALQRLSRHIESILRTVRRTQGIKQLRSSHLTSLTTVRGIAALCIRRCVVVSLYDRRTCALRHIETPDGKQLW